MQSPGISNVREVATERRKKRKFTWNYQNRIPNHLSSWNFQVFDIQKRCHLITPVHMFGRAAKTAKTSCDVSCLICRGRCWSRISSICLNIMLNGFTFRKRCWRWSQTEIMMILKSVEINLWWRFMETRVTTIDANSPNCEVYDALQNVSNLFSFRSLTESCSELSAVCSEIVNRSHTWLMTLVKWFAQSVSFFTVDCVLKYHSTLSRKEIAKDEGT